MPHARICLDCNTLYPPPTDQTRDYGRCPHCRPQYLSRKPRGKHKPTPERALAQAFYRSGAWGRTRRIALNRDQACTSCGTTRNLSVHHIVSIRDAPELSLDPTNLTTLCQRCHAKTENDQRRRTSRRKQA